jgi:hypothetical protein
MAQREMSGKALLDKLYSGLDTMPKVEGETNARDLRRLTDEFLGKPTELTATGQHAATPSPAARTARSASGAKILRSSLVVVLSVGLVGVIAAAALRGSDKRAALPPPPPVVVPAPEPAPPVQTVAEAPPPEPVVLVNPFDKTEKFTFPPGTSKADARDQMAALLLQRAMERGANRPRARKLAAEPHAPKNAPKTGHGS